MVSSFIRFAKSRRLLPEAYLYGLAHVHKRAQSRRAFLNGQYSEQGWRSFFPYCFLVKTPLSVLAVLVLAAAAAILRRRPAGARPGGRAPATIRQALYDTAPLWVLLGVYWTAAIASNINIGHRHILPTYPPMFVLAGAAAWWFGARRRALRALAAAAVVGLAVESVLVWPHYLAFFNQAAGGSRNGYRHLVDSSLDWGQDLPALKRWLDRNGLSGQDQRPVYLSYFGTGSPRYYGIEARRLPGYPDWERPEKLIDLKGGVYCVSATMLQAVYLPPWGHWTARREEAYQYLRSRTAMYLGSTPAGRADLRRLLGDEFWERVFRLFDDLRLARLFAFLRGRRPDAHAGYTILIYRLSDEDVARALHGPPPEMFDERGSGSGR